MAETQTTQTEQAPAPAQTSSPAPAAPETQAPTPTGDQAIQEARGRPPGSPPIRARDFDRAMKGSEQTSTLLTESQPTPPGQAAPAEEGASTPEGDRTKPNRAGEQQPINERGQYQGKQEAGSEATPTAEGEAATESHAEGEGHEPQTTPEPSAEAAGEVASDAEETTEPEAVSEVPEGYVRIQVPEALQRNFGTDVVVPKAHEEAMRWNFNNQVRNSEIETLRGRAERAAELEKQVEEYRNKTLQTEAQSEAAQQFKETDQYKRYAERYQAMRMAENEGSLPEGSASEYWQDAVLPAFRSYEQEVLVGKQKEFAEQQAEMAGQRWVNQMWSEVNTLPDAVTSLPRFQEQFNAAVDAFNYEAEQGRFDHIRDAPNPAEAATMAFKRYFHSRLLGLYPEAAEAIKRSLSERQRTEQQRASAQQEAERKRAQREAADTARQEKEAAARRAAENPMGNVPSGQVHRHAEGDNEKMNARQFDRLMSRRG